MPYRDVRVKTVKRVLALGLNKRYAAKYSLASWAHSRHVEIFNDKWWDRHV